MRILYVIALISVLVGCQSSSDFQGTPGTIELPTTESPSVNPPKDPSHPKETPPSPLPLPSPSPSPIDLDQPLQGIHRGITLQVLNSHAFDQFTHDSHNEPNGAFHYVIQQGKVFPYVVVDGIPEHNYYPEMFDPNTDLCLLRSADFRYHKNGDQIRFDSTGIFAGSKEPGSPVQSTFEAVSVSGGLIIDCQRRSKHSTPWTLRDIAEIFSGVAMPVRNPPTPEEKGCLPASSVDEAKFLACYNQGNYSFLDISGLKLNQPGTYSAVTLYVPDGLTSNPFIFRYESAVATLKEGSHNTIRVLLTQKDASGKPFPSYFRGNPYWDRAIIETTPSFPTWSDVGGNSGECEPKKAGDYHSCFDREHGLW